MPFVRERYRFRRAERAVLQRPLSARAPGLSLAMPGAAEPSSSIGGIPPHTLFPQYGTARREEERPSGRLRQAGKRCPLGEHAHEKRRRNIVRIRERQSDQEGEGRVGQQHQRKDDARRDVSEDPYRGVEGGYPGKIEAVQAYGEVDQKVYQVAHQ